MNRNSLKLLIVVFIYICLLASICNADDNIPNIIIKPDVATITALNQIIKVTVAAQGVTNLYGIDLDIVYDPTVLTAVDQNGNEISNITLGPDFSTPNKFVVRNQVDNASGNIKLAVSFLRKEQGITGKSDLGFVCFKVKRVTATTIEIEKKMLVVINQATGQISEIPSESRNGSLTIGDQLISGPGITNQGVINAEVTSSNTISNAHESEKATTPSVPTAAIAKNLTFKDIEGSWAKDEIQKAASLGIISGDGKGNYKPQNNVTREEFAKIICSAMGLKVAESRDAAFLDEKGISSWAKAYVYTASKANLITGDNGRFYPKKSLTRYEIAVILARALNLNELPTGCDSFMDKDKIPTWAKGYVGAVAKIGLMKGTPDGIFSGSTVVSREQAASLIIRFMELKLN